MRRWRDKYEEHGYTGLWDHRKGQPSPKRLPVRDLETVLQLYRERYCDLNVLHFHEKLRDEHDIHFSYTWVKTAPQEAGADQKGEETRLAPQAVAEAPAAGHDAAHRRQRAWLVPGRTTARFW